MNTLREIEAAILGLSEQDRLHVADKISRSLPKPPGAMVSEEILAEAIRTQIFNLGVVIFDARRVEKQDEQGAFSSR